MNENSLSVYSAFSSFYSHVTLSERPFKYFSMFGNGVSTIKRSPNSSPSCQSATKFEKISSANECFGPIDFYWEHQSIGEIDEYIYRPISYRLFVSVIYLLIWLKSTHKLSYPRTSPSPQGSTSLGGFTWFRVSGRESSLTNSKSMRQFQMEPKVDWAEPSTNSSETTKSITSSADCACWKSPVMSSTACANARTTIATPAWTPTPSARSRGSPSSSAPTRSATRWCPCPAKSTNTCPTPSRSSFSRTRTSSGLRIKRKTGASDAYSRNILEPANTPLNRSW